MISTKKLLYKVIQSIGNSWQTVYPVGSYYETSDTSFDPNQAWGGTWSLEAEGLVHIGAGSNYTAGSTGGETEHTLTSAESGRPAWSGSHSHTPTTSASHKFLTSPENVKINGSGRNFPSTGGSAYYLYADAQGAGVDEERNTSSATISIAAANATNAHNNMQPYVVVNRWHRTA